MIARLRASFRRLSNRVARFFMTPEFNAQMDELERRQNERRSDERRAADRRQGDRRS